MLPQKGLVSVIIPTYERNEMLERAIVSVLNQTYKNIEVIVIDDNNNGSKYREKTQELMEKYSDDKRVKYIKHIINKNGAAARNTGINNSRGEFISFLDDDDEYMIDKVFLQLERLESLDTSWGGIYCACATYRNDIQIKLYNNCTEGDLRKELLLMENSIFAGSTFLARRQAIEELNGFDESFTRHQDWEMLIRFFRKYKIAYVNQILVKIHMDSNINRRINAENMEVLKLKYLNDFMDDINIFSIDIQHQIFKKHYYQIMTAYIMNKKYNKAYYWYKKSTSNSNLSRSEIVNLIKLILISLVDKRLKNIIRKYLERLK